MRDIAMIKDMADRVGMTVGCTYDNGKLRSIRVNSGNIIIEQFNGPIGRDPQYIIEEAYHNLRCRIESTHLFKTITTRRPRQPDLLPVEKLMSRDIWESGEWTHDETVLKAGPGQMTATEVMNSQIAIGDMAVRQASKTWFVPLTEQEERALNIKPKLKINPDL